MNHSYESVQEALSANNRIPPSLKGEVITVGDVVDTVEEYELEQKYVKLVDLEEMAKDSFNEK